jgi:hypothetical protein
MKLRPKLSTKEILKLKERELRSKYSDAFEKVKGEFDKHQKQVSEGFKSNIEKTNEKSREDIGRWRSGFKKVSIWLFVALTFLVISLVINIALILL